MFVEPTAAFRTAKHRIYPKRVHRQGFGVGGDIDKVVVRRSSGWLATSGSGALVAASLLLPLRLSRLAPWSLRRTLLSAIPAQASPLVARHAVAPFVARQSQLLHGCLPKVHKRSGDLYCVVFMHALGFAAQRLSNYDI